MFNRPLSFSGLLGHKSLEATRSHIAKYSLRTDEPEVNCLVYLKVASGKLLFQEIIVALNSYAMVKK